MTKEPELELVEIKKETDHEKLIKAYKKLDKHLDELIESLRKRKNKENEII